ncbi:MAG: hypothetical protein WBA93_22665 [Microcoleaceae cyanobacterium]
MITTLVIARGVSKLDFTALSIIPPVAISFKESGCRLAMTGGLLSWRGGWVN